MVYQPPFDSKFYSGINPYALGFNMMQDIRRICENPTPEDKKWFPEIAGSNWQETLTFAMQNFKDESFVQQFLSPKIIREFKFFALNDDDKEKDLHITAIHDDPGYRDVREALSKQYNLSMNEPNIQVYNVNVRGDRSITLRHVRHNRRPLEQESAEEVLKHLHRLWKFDVVLESVQDNTVMDTIKCGANGIEKKSTDVDEDEEELSLIQRV